MTVSERDMDTLYECTQGRDSFDKLKFESWRLAQMLEPIFDYKERVEEAEEERDDVVSDLDETKEALEVSTDEQEDLEKAYNDLHSQYDNVCRLLGNANEHLALENKILTAEEVEERQQLVNEIKETIKETL